ncbi:hypothetical protein ACJ73_09966 [Blastomyces percursus]|uniref:Uncharacterized protein n=1 Tax=Blastomyces percursus TaxID=1658174 RepID=A0A1J9NZP2_9EURO|nr:hypothetical protein ACJ73_09966 [Blastomyces percursus]
MDKPPGRLRARFAQSGTAGHRHHFVAKGIYVPHAVGGALGGTRCGD